MRVPQTMPTVGIWPVRCRLWEVDSLMRSNTELAQRIDARDAQNNSDRKQLADEACDLIRQHLSLTDQLDATGKSLTSVLRQLEKLMNLEDFASDADLTKAERALLPESGSGHPTKTRSRTATNGVADRRAPTKQLGGQSGRVRPSDTSAAVGTHA